VCGASPVAAGASAGEAPAGFTRNGLEGPMPITPEMIAERAAAVAEKDAAKAAIEEATTRYEAARARIDAAHAAIAAELQEGEMRVLAPSPAAVLVKKDGRIVQGVLASLHPNPPAASS
jgi:hypothetical protein